MTTNSAAKAVEIAHSLVNTGVYRLGTGNRDTPKGGESDCFGFAFDKCYGVLRHRPGFNHGPWASVEDDLNCNSAIEDSEHKQELFLPLSRPEPGALLTYPTIRMKSPDGVVHQFIGHVAIIVKVPAEWDPAISRYAELDVIQCCGPNGRKPAILLTNASHWDNHDKLWPKPEHRTKILKVKGS